MASVRFSDARIVLQPSYSTLSESARRASFDGSLGMERQYTKASFDGRLGMGRQYTKASFDGRLGMGRQYTKASFDGRLGMGRQYTRVVDSVSCRQMYLRSYTFTRKESVPEKTKKYIREVKTKVFGIRFGVRTSRAKYDEVPCSALFSAVRRILTCTVRIDVADLDVHRYI